MALAGAEHWARGFVWADSPETQLAATTSLVGAASWAGFLRDPDGRLVYSAGPPAATPPLGRRGFDRDANDALVVVANQSSPRLYPIKTAPSPQVATRPAGAGADQAGIGTIVWAGPGNIVASDDVRATATAIPAAGVSHYLVASAFGFAITAGATINGITVNIERSGNTGAAIVDQEVKLVKAGVIQATNKALVPAWPAVTDAVASYGGAADLWALAWTPTDINDPGFGVAIAASNPGVSAFTARVDYMEIIVNFTA